jgi:hypothetical protein
MAFPGYSKPTQFVYDAGIVQVGGVTAFVSEGGVTFDPGVEMRHVEFDGLQSEYAGGHRIVGRRPTFTGRMKDLSIAAHMRYEPGSTSDGSTGSNTITPKAGRSFFSTGDYLQDVSFVLNKSDGLAVRYVFDYALVVGYRVITPDKDEADVEVEIRGVLDPNAALEDCPFTIQYETA